MGLGDFLGGVFGTTNEYQASGPSNAALGQASGQVNNAYQQQQNFLNQLWASNQNVFNDQVNLQRQLEAQAAGGGPNPALSQLALTTGQNVNNQAALMAGQRGIRANPGLAARQIAGQGSAIQQNAAGQAATMRAQQQLAAQQQLGQVIGNQLGQRQQAIAGLGGLGLSNQGQLLGANQGANQINAGVAAGNQQTNAAIIGGIMSGAGAAAGMGGAPSAPAAKAHGGMIGMADGGMIPMADGGALGVNTMMPGVAPMPMANPLSLGANTQLPAAPMVNPGPNKYSLNVDMSMPNEISQPSGAQSRLANFMGGMGNGMISDKNNPLFQGVSNFIGGTGQGARNLFRPGDDATTTPIVQGGKVTGEMVPKSSYSKGGKTEVVAQVSPGELYFKPEEAIDVATGNVNPNEVGEKIPGKAKVKGDNYKNDVVTKRLEVGGAVVPRTKVKDPQKIANFIRDVLGM